MALTTADSDGNEPMNEPVALAHLGWGAFTLDSAALPPAARRPSSVSDDAATTTREMVAKHATIEAFLAQQRLEAAAAAAAGPTPHIDRGPPAPAPPRPRSRLRRVLRPLLRAVTGLGLVAGGAALGWALFERYMKTLDDRVQLAGSLEAAEARERRLQQRCEGLEHERDALTQRLASAGTHSSELEARVGELGRALAAAQRTREEVVGHNLRLQGKLAAAEAREAEATAAARDAREAAAHAEAEARAARREAAALAVKGVRAEAAAAATAAAGG